MTAYCFFRDPQLVNQLPWCVWYHQQVVCQEAYVLKTKTQLASSTLQQLQQWLLCSSFSDWDSSTSPGIWIGARPGWKNPEADKLQQLLLLDGFDTIIFVDKCWFISQDQRLHLLPSNQLIDPLQQSTYSDWKSLLDECTSQQIEPTVCHYQPSQLAEANQQLGLQLDRDEIAYLCTLPAATWSDAALMMFSQAQSEHCRHLVFRQRWRWGEQVKSFFSLIKATYHARSEGIWSAYTDNAAVFEAGTTQWWHRQPTYQGMISYENTTAHLGWVLKAETHNHPTAICPYPGAATGHGGEIRDEIATGVGARALVGLTGLIVSQLFQSAEDEAHPLPAPHLAHADQIMIQAPFGGADYGNSFGRPQVLGFFRSFSWQDVDRAWGFHKPLMLAAGIGVIHQQHVHKKKMIAGSWLLVLGGEGLPIGLGGGRQSSLVSDVADLDFASVQRGYPEMQRQAQQVIDACVSLLDDNPIQSLHDVGAGGLANAIPELLWEQQLGGCIDLDVLVPSNLVLSPLQIWCNEAQERFVLAVAAEDFPLVYTLCHRSRCPVIVVGEATCDQQLKVSWRGELVIDQRMSWLFSVPEKPIKDLPQAKAFLGGQTKLPDWQDSLVKSLCQQVISSPTVASKQYLVTIADRSVTGQVGQESMVGKRQVAVADCSVFTATLQGDLWLAVSMAERSPLAIASPAASVRVVLAEALLNLAGAIASANGNKLHASANWHINRQDPTQIQALAEGVETLSEACVELGITIPVGKDSTSMQANWKTTDGQRYAVQSPMSLVLTLTAPALAPHLCLTPAIADQHAGHRYDFYWFDLGHNEQALGGSIVSLEQNTFGGDPADLDSVALLAKWWSFWMQIRDDSSAYHDISDGGLWACLLEIAFASGVGIEITLPAERHWYSSLFSENPGCVVVVSSTNQEAFQRVLANWSYPVYQIAHTQTDSDVTINWRSHRLAIGHWQMLESLWHDCSDRMRLARGEPEQLIKEERYWRESGQSLVNQSVPIQQDPWMITVMKEPSVALVCREQGINGEQEMAWALAQAGFQVLDVTGINWDESLLNQPVKCLVFPGGFSFGDVLGAGYAWAKMMQRFPCQDILATLRRRPEVLSLGVCNGCQALAILLAQEEDMPTISPNHSGVFESRVVSVKIEDDLSPWLSGMKDWILPVPIAHGQGRISWRPNQKRRIALSYVDPQGQRAVTYPCNPNGSEESAAACLSQDGRTLMMMPHPERAVHAWQQSWRSGRVQAEITWLSLFRRAYAFSIT